MRPTFHLVPEPLWMAADPKTPYRHASLQTEGFIHCTDGRDEVVAVGNRYYRDDPRPFVILTVDLDRAGSPWRIEPPGSPYPHIYGPIERGAIVAVERMPRGADGTFVRWPAEVDQATTR